MEHDLLRAHPRCYCARRLISIGVEKSAILTKQYGRDDRDDLRRQRLTYNISPYLRYFSDPAQVAIRTYDRTPSQQTAIRAIEALCLHALADKRRNNIQVCLSAQHHHHDF